MTEAGPLALLMVGLLAAATVFLLRSLNKQLRKVPRTFEPPPEEPGRPEPGPSPPPPDGGA